MKKKSIVYKKMLRSAKACWREDPESTSENFWDLEKEDFEAISKLASLVTCKAPKCMDIRPQIHFFEGYKDEKNDLAPNLQIASHTLIEIPVDALKSVVVLIRSGMRLTSEQLNLLKDAYTTVEHD